MVAYYNEHEPYAAAWLRNLSAENLIAPGHVDERDIQDVTPDDLRGFDQCHFFAGLGGWSLALRLAGVPDEAPIWTGSCPCQPFSGAGKGGGFDDSRHLWPFFFRLIAECRPPITIGEQVGSPLGLAWLDSVHADMEGAGYTFGAADLCAASVGAPHRRQRLFWVGESNGAGPLPGFSGPATTRFRDTSEPTGGVDGLADKHGVFGVEGCPVLGGRDHGSDAEPWSRSGGGDESCGLADLDLPGLEGRGLRRDRSELRALGSDGLGDEGLGPTNGFWRDADWLRCRDGKWRSVEAGTFPLAPRLPNFVGQLRAAGNSIVPQVAAEFIKAFLECRP